MVNYSRVQALLLTLPLTNYAFLKFLAPSGPQFTCRVELIMFHSLGEDKINTCETQYGTWNVKAILKMLTATNTATWIKG